MLRSSFAAIGIGRAYDAAAGYGWYWTTIFGGRFDLPGTICGQTVPLAPPTSLTSANAVATSDLNLRSDPAPTSSLLSTVPPGSRLEVTGAEQAGYIPGQLRRTERLGVGGVRDVGSAGLAGDRADHVVLR